MVIREALVITCAGLAIGFPLAYWGNRLAGRLIGDLPRMSAVPIVFGAVAVVAVVLLAAWLPAQRASSVDPIEALRYE